MNTNSDTQLVLGLVGGIGSGKTAVSEILREAGCVVSNSDRVSHEVMKSSVVRDQIYTWWGDEVFDSEGMLDRTLIAAKVFNNTEELKRLEALLHPIINETRARQFAASPDARAYVIDAPLLIETGLDADCDVVIMVDSAREDRLKRVAARGWSEEELDKREALQLPLDQKRIRADHILINDGSEAALRTRTFDLLEQLAPRTDEERR